MKKIFVLLFLLLLSVGVTYSQDTIPDTIPMYGTTTQYLYTKKSTQVKYLIASEIALRNALQIAKPNDVIFVTQSFICKSAAWLHIPGYITIASNGKTISFPNYIPGSRDTAAVFITTGPNITIRDINFIGPQCYQGDESYEFGFSQLIKVSNENFFMYNCDVECFPVIGVWLHYAPFARIEHCTFRNQQGAGFGISVWVGGSSYNQGWTATIKHNIFENGRHFIGSSGHFNNIVADTNLFAGNTSNHSIDRHTYNQVAYGGGSYFIRGNVFYHHNRFFGLQYPQDSNSVIEIHNNYCLIDSLRAGTIIDSLYWKIRHDRIHISDNYFSGKNFPDIAKYLSSDPIIDSTGIDTLSFYLNDTYLGLLRNRYVVRVMNGDSILYQQDLYTKTNWRQIKVKIPKTGPLTIRFYCINPSGLVSCAVYVDDIYINKIHYSFDNGTLSPFRIKLYAVPGSNSIGSGISTNDSYSGEYSIKLDFGLGKKYLPGSYADIIIR